VEELVEAKAGILMVKSEYQKMFEAEDSFFWFVAKQFLVDRLLMRLNLPENPLILDLGSGTGNNLKHLEKSGFAIGLDCFEEALRYCLTRGLRDLILSRGEVLPFAENSFDLVTSLDTIEHTDDPDSMVKEVYRTLKPGGYFLITAPAFQFLYSRHDYALKHKIRYSRKLLSALLTRTGFQIEVSGNFFGFLFPLGAALKMAQKFIGSKTETLPYHLPFPVNRILLWVCNMEAKLFPYLRMPFGTTLVFLCRKK